MRQVTKVTNIIVELSKYLIILLMACYTFSCFSIFTKEYMEDEKRVLIMQNIVMFLMLFSGIYGDVSENERTEAYVLLCGAGCLFSGGDPFILADLSDSFKTDRQ